MLASAPLTPQPALLPPAGPPTPPARSEEGACFAQMLSASAPPPPPAPVHTPAAAPAAPPQNLQSGTDRSPVKTTNARPTGTPPPRGTNSGEAKARSAEPAAPGQDTGATRPAQGTTGTTGAKDSNGDDDHDAAHDAKDATQQSVDEFTGLMGLTSAPRAQDLADARHGSAHSAASRGRTQDEGDGADRIDARDDSRTGAGNKAPRWSGADLAGPRSAAQRATDAAGRQALDAAGSRAAAAGSLSFALQLQDASALPAGANPAGALPAAMPAGLDPALAALAAPSAAGATGSAAGMDAPSPTATLQSPLHSTAFSAELGTRVSLLATDGVQQAELQLNPAEMGPVTVQITVDGTQAHVSFHAAQAETRQALERSLPDLAAALQGGGLTLSGGGVFQQPAREQAPGGRSDGDSAAGSRRGATTATGGTEPVQARAPALRRVGLLDTFA